MDFRLRDDSSWKLYYRPLYHAIFKSSSNSIYIDLLRQINFKFWNFWIISSFLYFSYIRPVPLVGTLLYIMSCIWKRMVQKLRDHWNSRDRLWNCSVGWFNFRNFRPTLLRINVSWKHVWSLKSWDEAQQLFCRSRKTKTYVHLIIALMGHLSTLSLKWVCTATKPSSININLNINM